VKQETIKGPSAPEIDGLATLAEDARESAIAT